MSKVTEKSAPNKITEKAGLSFNVNTVKNKLKDYYESQALKSPMNAGGQVAITAVLEKFYELLLSACIKNTGVDKSGVRMVNRDLLRVSVLLNDEMKEYCSVRLSRFNKDQIYADQTPIARSELEQVMATVDENMALSEKACNLANYLTLCVFLDLASTCNHLLTFADKKSLTGNCVIFAVKLKFPSGLAHTLCTEVTRSMKSLGEEVDEELVDAEDAPSNNEDPEDEHDNQNAEEEKTVKKTAKAPATKETKETKEAKPTKPPAKTTKPKQIVEEEPEEEVADEEQQDPDEEAEVDATPVEKPKKTVKPKAPIPNKKK